MEKKIFISHSSKDSMIVEKIIEILEAMNVPSNRIFCTSFEGYGIQLGEDFLDRIKTELNNEVLVLFIISPNFYESPVSLCEMGATWVKTSEHIPILFPKIDFKDLRGVISGTQGFKITDKPKYNLLKDRVEYFLELPAVSNSIWERKRDKVLIELTNIIESQGSIIPESITQKIKKRIISRFVELNAKPAHTIDERWINMALASELNPKEQDSIEIAIDQLVKEGLIKIKNRNGMDCLELTEKGYTEIY